METQFSEAVKAYGVRGLASKLGITPAYVSMIANGKRPLSANLLTSVNKQLQKSNPKSCSSANSDTPPDLFILG